MVFKSKSAATVEATRGKETPESVGHQTSPGQGTAQVPKYVVWHRTLPSLHLEVALDTRRDLACPPAASPACFSVPCLALSCLAQLLSRLRDSSGLSTSRGPPCLHRRCLAFLHWLSTPVAPRQPPSTLSRCWDATAHQHHHKRYVQINPPHPRTLTYCRMPHLLYTKHHELPFGRYVSPSAKHAPTRRCTSTRAQSGEIEVRGPGGPCHVRV